MNVRNVLRDISYISEKICVSPKDILLSLGDLPVVDFISSLYDESRFVNLFPFVEFVSYKVSDILNCDSTNDLVLKKFKQNYHSIYTSYSSSSDESFFTYRIIDRYVCSILVERFNYKISDFDLLNDGTFLCRFIMPCNCRLYNNEMCSDINYFDDYGSSLIDLFMQLSLAKKGGFYV